jgi:hypothetical protein
MRDDQSREELRAVWQSQPTGTTIMTTKLIHSKARELHSKTRRQLLGTGAGPLAAVFFYAFGISVLPLMRQVLHPLFALALVWSLVGLYLLNRGMWSSVLPGDAGISTGLEFCREELDRRRRLLRGVLLWSLGPVVLAIGTLILGLGMAGTKEKGLFPNGLPFLGLVVVWILAYFVKRAREQRELRREIEDLNDLERDSSR